MPGDLLQVTNEGLWCPVGGFHIDPWGPVDRAVITHGHSDHARWGSRHYLATPESLPILRLRLGRDASLEGLRYGEARVVNGVRISLHPAGHLLGSAQVRVEHGGEVWVVTGDYKTVPDSTCAPFELVSCDTFITECTFGLPIYCWRPQEEIFAEISDWWRSNQEAGRTSVLFGYALGKAQRLLAGLEPSIGPILIHGALEKLNEAYRAQGIHLPATMYASPEAAKHHKGRALVLAPPSAQGAPWIRKFAPYSTAFASGWMQVRGRRRQRALDRGFVLSDHVDWPCLLQTIEATGAERVLATHGYTRVVARHLSERGWNATALETQYVGEGAEEAIETPLASGEDGES